MSDPSAPGPIRAAPGALGSALAERPPRLAVRQARVVSILVGGGLGALARAGIAHGLPGPAGSWPWATFLANLAGSLLLGWLITRLSERIALTQHWRTLLGTGLCGALTTFSSFQVDTIHLARDAGVGLAVAYSAASTVAGLALAVAGTVAARWGRYG